MCGIAGIFLKKANGGDLQSPLNTMMACLHHRGPDDNGQYINQELGLALGQLRLSIIDLTPSGHQPMFSPDNRYIMVFNGEIYNYQELRAELGDYAWRGTSDSEVLLAQISRFGFEAALKKASGMFAIALFDLKTRTISFARDRMGEKPLYLYENNQAFYFASEISAFAHLSPSLNRGAAALMMRHNYIPAPYSIYENCEKILPGAIKIVSRETISQKFYYDFAQIAQDKISHQHNMSFAQSVLHCEALLKKSISQQMIADVPLGAFLSGGVDSSLIVALMQEMSSQKVKSFAIGFDNPEFNEAGFAQKVAEHIGTDHTQLIITEQEALNVIPDLPKIYAEPFSDSSQIPTYLVAKLARTKVTVSLSGDAGDELFSGYSRYDLGDGIWQKISPLPQNLRRTIGFSLQYPSQDFYNNIRPLLSLLKPKFAFSNLGYKIHKLGRILQYANQDFYHAIISHWMNPLDIINYHHEPSTQLTNNPIHTHNIIERMQYLDMISYLPDDIFCKVDRAAMANSLETRVPFCMPELVEFALNTPTKIHRHEKQSKALLRAILYKYVPKTLIERPKMGFGVPLDQWLRGKLRPWAEELLSEKSLNSHGMFHAKPIINAWNLHKKGENYGYLLWDILCLQGFLLKN